MSEKDKKKTTAPKDSKSAVTGVPLESDSSGKVIFSRAEDKSLEAFKNWIRQTTLFLNPDAKETMSEAEWVEAWKQFWKDDEGANPQKPSD